VSTENEFAPRTLSLPAVLQVDGHAPCFGSIASLSNQGLAFDCQTGHTASHAVGLTAQLDFDLQDQHHSCGGLIVHSQDQRVLLSLRGASTKVLTALQSVNRDNMPSLSTRRSILQAQQACHARFMDSMKAVVEDFYLLLPEAIQNSIEKPVEPDALAEFTQLQNALIALRPEITRKFTQTYPMYPELIARADALSIEPTDPDDMGKVDDWIRRTTIAQQVEEAIAPLPDELNLHYSKLVKSTRKQATHPYQPDTILNVLADLITPLKPGLNSRILCYDVMGLAFQNHALALYQDLLGIIGEVPTESDLLPQRITNLEQWLSLSASASSAIEGGGGPTIQVTELATLLDKLTTGLGELNERMPASAFSQSDSGFSGSRLIPGLLARDRIFDRFLPAETTGTRFSQGGPSLLDSGVPAVSAVGQVLGGLTDLDNAALQGLYALMRQQPVVESGPEKLAQASQVRVLMLQAQGLLLEYTLNGLTYQAQPNHPAWRLVNSLDALHQGADNRGQFLDPALHQAVSLSMQWLLGQDDVDTALEQINTLLAKINSQLHADRQSRRAMHLLKLGALDSDHTLINTGWCIVKQDDEAIPYEVLGRHDDNWVLLDRSATNLMKVSVEHFLQALSSGQIEETQSYDEDFLERIADVTLTASLDAVHTYTWQDPASGCLKRSALMDELERRLVHPVTEPPSFCALIEIPTMRPSLSSLPGDELAVLQKRTGEMLLETLETGEHCGRLSDVSFLMVFSPQNPDQLMTRLAQLKSDMENLHAEWKMIGAIVPLAEKESPPTPSNLLLRANQACTQVRKSAEFDLLRLSTVPALTNRIDPLPFSALYLRCQKIASCDEGALSHYEILLGVSEDLVPSHTTQSFVVMAEQTGCIYDLDTWVLKSTLEWMNQNLTGLEKLSGLSVNLSGNSLTKTEHVDAIVDLLSDFPHLTKKLIFEVTETAAIGNLDAAVLSLHKLRNLGCRIALDDFGSGYSSYSYLRSLPLDYLKIDGTYIRNILTDKTDQALTASMVDVAHALGLKVIAEYVDSEAARDWLKEQGVDYVQGYWVHKPERLDSLALHHTLALVD